MKRRYITKKDLLIIIIVLSLSFLIYKILFTNKEQGDIYRITVNNEIFKEGTLTKDEIINVNEHIKIQIQNESIAFISSDCPDKVCINTGFIKFNGQQAVCLPNKTIVTIISSGENNLDGLVY